MVTETPDTLNAIGVLTRREIEARLVAPLMEAFSEAIDREQTLAILHQVVVDIARQQGTELAIKIGGTSLSHFASIHEDWKKGDALLIEVLEQNETRFSFNVNRCRYAEMYQVLGLPSLGCILSCSRDQALVEGFNPQIQLTRTQTIMEGAPFCDFRYTLNNADNQAKPAH